MRNPAEAIRLAGMIDERGGRAAAAGVDAPVIVDLANAHLPPACDSTRGFTIRNFLAHELAHLASHAKRRRRKATSAVDAGSFYYQLRRSGFQGRAADGTRSDSARAPFSSFASKRS